MIISIMEMIGEFLPQDCMDEVASYLSSIDLVSLVMVNQDLHTYTSELVSNMFVRNFPAIAPHLEHNILNLVALEELFNILDGNPIEDMFLKYRLVPVRDNAHFSKGCAIVSTIQKMYDFLYNILLDRITSECDLSINMHNNREYVVPGEEEGNSFLYLNRRDKIGCLHNTKELEDIIHQLIAGGYDVVDDILMCNSPYRKLCKMSFESASDYHEGIDIEEEIHMMNMRGKVVFPENMPEYSLIQDMDEMQL